MPTLAASSLIHRTMLAVLAVPGLDALIILVRRLIIRYIMHTARFTAYALGHTGHSTSTGPDMVAAAEQATKSSFAQYLVCSLCEGFD